MTAQPPPATEFARVLARDTGAWWRLVVAAVLGILGLFVTSALAVLTTIGAARLLGYDEFAFSSDDGINAAEMLATNAGLAALIPLSGGLGWLLYRARPRWLSSTRPGLRWSWLITCAGMATVVWSIFLVLGSLGAYVSRSSPVDLGVVLFVIVVLLTTPLQAAGEEYLFRGLLLQALGATRLPVLLCCAISGALFATAHLQFAAPLFADRFALGFALAWLANRTGGLEAGIAIHAVKNVSVLIPAGLLDSVSDALDPSGVTWLPLILDVVLLSIVVPWIVFVLRRRERPPPRPAIPAGWPPPPVAP